MVTVTLVFSLIAHLSNPEPSPAPVSAWGARPGFYVGDRGGALALDISKGWLFSTGNQWKITD